MGRRLTQVTVLLVVIAMGAGDAMAATAAAMLHGNGGVSVNGTAATPTTTVFAGDRIDTAPDSAASLTMNGSSVLVNQNSSLVYNGQSVSFTSGAAIVNTSQGMGAKFERVTITPTQPTAKFQLVQKGNTLTVAALEGNLSITNGTNHLGLNTGKSVEIELSAKNEANTTSSTTATAPAAPPQAAGGGAPAFSGMTAGVVAAASGAVAAAITGIIAVSQKSISPSKP